MAVRVRVDRELCEGTGVCIHLDPDHFEMSEDGYAQWRDDAPTEPDEATLQEVVGNCPQAAISLEK